jgi:transcriptional regulator with XRE-family HTH domain
MASAAPPLDLPKLLKLLGHRIRQLRGKRPVSTLAASVRMSPTYWNDVERATKNVTLAKLLLFATALEVELKDLFEFPPAILAKVVPEPQLIEFLKNIKQSDPRLYRAMLESNWVLASLLGSKKSR